MSKRGFVCMAAALAGLTAAGCASTSVNADYDQSYDFSTLQGYAWAEISGDEQAADPLTLRRVQEATDEVLAGKGFKKVDPGQAGFLVAIQTGKQEQTQYTTYGMGGGWRLGGGMETTTAQTYDEGTLIVDAKKKKLIWRGSASGTLDPGASAVDRTKNVNEAVSKILADFPPEGGS